MSGRNNSRERLLDAADELMYARGYEAVSVADLCAAADARKGSFYHWWPSKRDLTLAMLGRAMERNRTRLFVPIFGAPGLVKEKFHQYADALADGLAAKRDKSGHVVGCRFGNFAVELSTRDPVIRKQVAAALAEIGQVFEDTIQEGIETGELHAGIDPADSATTIVAIMEGLMVLAKANDDPDLLRRLGDDAERLLTLDAQEKRRPH